MADVKISALPAATTPLAGTEVLPIVQSGVTDKVTVANLTAGRSVSVADLTATTGNLVIGTSGKGIDFSANAHASGMTKELLDWYEEGTWTPNQGAGLTVVGAFTSSGYYTRIGRLVTVNFSLNGSTSIAVSGGGQLTTNLPYTGASAAGTAGTLVKGDLTGGGTVEAYLNTVYSAQAITSANGNKIFLCSVTYEV